MQAPFVDFGSLASSTTRSPQTMIDFLPYDDDYDDDISHCHCACCYRAVRVPASFSARCQPLRDAARRTVASIASGIRRYAQIAATAVPHAIGFYGAALAVKGTVTAIASHDLWLECALNLRPLCCGHLKGLAAVCATVYTVDAIVGDRQRRGIPSGLGGLASRVLHLSSALGAAACCLVWLVPHIYRSKSVWGRSFGWPLESSFETGMVCGVVLGALVSIVVASVAVILESPCKVAIDIRRAVAYAINVGPALAAGSGSQLHHCGDLLLPLLHDNDRPQHDVDTRQMQP